MTRFIMAMLFAISLAACATEANYEAALAQWMGASEETLVSAWGIPDKTYQLSPQKKLISYFRRSVTYDQTPVQCRMSAGGMTNCYGGDIWRNVYACETIFTLENGKVTRWGHKGNDCRA